MRDDSGATLVETMAAVSIMGLTVVGVVGALGSALLGTHAEQRNSTSDGILLSYRDAFRSSEVYVPCASPSDYAPSELGWDVPSGYRAEVVDVSLWDGTTSAAGFVPVPSDCGLLSDPGVQHLTLRVESVDGKGAPRSLALVWRQP